MFGAGSGKELSEVVARGRFLGWGDAVLEVVGYSVYCKATGLLKEFGRGRRD